jgi:hypothetical protein
MNGDRNYFKKEVGMLAGIGTTTSYFPIPIHLQQSVFICGPSVFSIGVAG